MTVRWSDHTDHEVIQHGKKSCDMSHDTKSGHVTAVALTHGIKGVGSRSLLCLEVARLLVVEELLPHQERLQKRHNRQCSQLRKLLQTGLVSRMVLYSNKILRQPRHFPGHTTETFKNK